MDRRSPHSISVFTVNELPNIKIRTTHRMKNDTLKDLIKLGSGAVKKKKGKGKKKKVRWLPYLLCISNARAYSFRLLFFLVPGLVAGGT